MRKAARLSLTVLLAALVLGVGVLASPVPVAAQVAVAGVPSTPRALPSGWTDIVWRGESVLLSTALSPSRVQFAPGVTPPARGVPHEYLSVWTWNPQTGAIRSWRYGAPAFVNTLQRFETGQRYWLHATAELQWGDASPSLLDRAQVVSLYGYPGIPGMGALGAYSADGAATEAIRRAREYAVLSGGKVLPALHLIVAVGQAQPGSDGLYLGRMPAELLDEYVRVTRERGLLLFLDVQIGWSDPLTETKRLAPWLAEPHVHLALDPEFATKRKGDPPGIAIGTVTGAEVNAVQDYLAGLGAGRKILVVHQFRDDMVTDPGDIRVVDGVDLVIDMDGFGPRFQKMWGYDRYALSAYSQYPAIKLFLAWDTPLMPPSEIQGFAVPPRLVIYQ